MLPLLYEALAAFFLSALIFFEEWNSVRITTVDSE